MAKPISYICGYSRPVYMCERCSGYTRSVAFTDDGDGYCCGCVWEGEWPKNSIYIRTEIDGTEIEDFSTESAEETILSYSNAYPKITNLTRAELALFTKSKI